eukprot:scaffold1062_cov130-Cylindrotheca_fusiformis.AAC.28
MEKVFQIAAGLVRETESDADSQPASNDEKLRLYGLYKHVVDGPCPADGLPPMYQVVARAKYQAWEGCRGLSEQEAMEGYVDLLASRSDRLGSRCQELLDGLAKNEAVHSSELDSSSDVVEKGNSMTSDETLGKVNRVKAVPTNDEYASMTNPTMIISSWMTYLFGLIGVRPFIPRGRLDISFLDLLFAMVNCFHWQGAERRSFQLTASIRDLWKRATGCEVAVGFSVRSLFDMYLCTKKYPENAEIVVYPPISVPGMMHVAKYHNLKLVPVDIGESDWWNWKDMEAAIHKKTVAIMIVHPFGMVTASEQQVAQLRHFANIHGIELWEDCAECFTGLGKNCYLGSPLADVRFFSFGMIKTSTALGGGIAVFQRKEVAKQIERLQRSLCKRQNTVNFFLRSCLALVLNMIAAFPLLYGFLVSVVSVFGLNYDQIVTAAIRGFQMSNIKNDEAFDEQIRGRIRAQLRQLPSSALLSLLLRRFQEAHAMSSSNSLKISRCQNFESILRDQVPEILIPNPPNVLNTYWAFPIFCKDRAVVSRHLQRRGFDVVGWVSQLRCIASAEHSATGMHPCPRTQQLMRSVLYLPISSQHLSPSSTRNLVASLRQIGEISESERLEDGSNQVWNVSLRMVLGMFVAWLVVCSRSLKWTVLPMLACSGMTAIWSLLALAFAVGVFQHFLRLSIASLYLHHSHWFMHFDMIDAATSDEPLEPYTSRKGESVLPKIGSIRPIELDSNPDGSANRKALLTGATGFVGSLLLRDLLFYRKELSVLGGVIVICRTKGRKSAQERIAQLLSKPMFDFLSDDEKSQLVDVVEGDMVKPSVGLSKSDFSRVVKDDAIFHVFHCAAAVSFTQDQSDAARSNISSTLAMQELASRIENNGVKFIHISTAFVHGNRTGSMSSPLGEELFPLSPYDPSEIYRSMLGTQFYATKAMSELGFPNTYAFSKCVCEHLLLQQNDTKTLIIRPSIVGPATESPFEGWAGGKPSTLVAASMLYLSLPWNIWHLPPHEVSFVPVDVLCRFVLSKAYASTSRNCDDSSEESSCSSSFQSVSRSNVSESTSDSGELISLSSSKMGVPKRIFNATWDSKSTDKSSFTWLDFGVAQCHLAVITGYVTRPIAFFALFIAARLMPTLEPSTRLYQQLHHFFIRHPISVLVSIVNQLELPGGGLSKVVPFLDLPLLFFPFVRAKFFFDSDLVGKDTFDGKRYAFSCGVAAHRFLESLKLRRSCKELKNKTQSQCGHTPRLTSLAVGGKHHIPQTNDFLWALSQPRGSYLFRLAALVFKKILRAVSSSVTVNVLSFQNLFSAVPTAGDERCCIILAPTHRSFFDFVLLSYIFFSLPELQLDIPFIVAADEFEQLPIIGILARMLRAFYIQRGRGYLDRDLSARLGLLKDKKLSELGGCIEVFLEGKRSRDRRFVEPKTGLLKGLQASGGHHLIVPIAISYEAIPEQKQMSTEASGAPRGALNIVGMLQWLAVGPAAMHFL